MSTNRRLCYAAGMKRSLFEPLALVLDLVLDLVSVSLALVLLALVTGCQAPPAPVSEEIYRDLSPAPRRAIDGTRLVFVAIGEDRFSERAKFLAESAAFEDIANECSLIPNGAKLEGVSEKADATESRIFYARAVVDRNACSEAKKADKPEQIRQLADAALTEQMKKYQDVVGEVNDPAPTLQAAIVKRPIRDESALMNMRQQIVYQKQKLVSDLNATVPANLPALMAVVASFEKANPRLANSKISWSHVQRRALQPIADPVLSEAAKAKLKNATNNGTNNGKSRPVLPPKKFPKPSSKPVVD